MFLLVNSALMRLCRSNFTGGMVDKVNVTLHAIPFMKKSEDLEHHCLNKARFLSRLIRENPHASVSYILQTIINYEDLTVSSTGKQNVEF